MYIEREHAIAKYFKLINKNNEENFNIVRKDE